MTPGLAHASQIAQPDMTELLSAIEYLPTDDLPALGRKSRIHSHQQIEQIAESIRTFGFINPILIDETGKVIAGNARIDAARKLKLTSLPCLRVSHLTHQQKRAFVIAENRLGELASWDNEVLRIEFEELIELKTDFSLEITGFSDAQIDTIVLAGEGGNERGDRSPPPPEAPVSQVGDLWLMDNHRLLCGDATDPEVVNRLMDGQSARTVFTDAPYNVPVAGHITGSGQHGEFVMASGEMTNAEFTTFLTLVFVQILTALVPGGIAYFCMDWRHMRNTLDAADAAGAELVNLIVWDKTAGGMGSFYRSRHELVFLFRKPGAPHLNRVQLGSNGRNRANVWAYDGVNGFGAAKARARELHPTVKPLAMVRDAILDSTARGDAVLDLFSGSGTTIIAAEHSGRRGHATELDPRYVDVGVIRWQDFTGRQARLATTGQTFAEVRTTRAAPAAAVSETLPPARVRTRLAA
jgi:DNA modification methylase